MSEEDIQRAIQASLTTSNDDIERALRWSRSVLHAPQPLDTLKCIAYTYPLRAAIEEDDALHMAVALSASQAT